jgi:hypothetical protein
MNLKLEREPSSRQGRCKSVHFLPTLHLTYLSSCLNCSPALATFKTSNHRYSQMVEILVSHPRLMVVVGEVAGWSPFISFSTARGGSANKSRASRQFIADASNLLLSTQTVYCLRRVRHHHGDSWSKTFGCDRAAVHSHTD